MAQLTKDERDWLIQETLRLDAEFRQLAAQKASRDEVKKTRELKYQRKTEYFEKLPRMAISACPFTGEPLIKAFDPWGIDGFWWQKTNLEKCDEPDPPVAFQLLQGAVHLNNLAPMGGREGALLGPEVPFVIPRILNMPGMIAVVSSIPLDCGYTAFPIAYYALSAPKPGSLAQTWRHSTYSFTLPDGSPGWNIPADPWDFDLQPWVEQNKLKWINPGDDTLQVNGMFWDKYPSKDLQGRRERQILCEDRLKTEPPPNDEDFDPFGT